jgi:poly-gamma-glutamate synthesis protein (capsule biosynthesis protein)
MATRVVFGGDAMLGRLVADAIAMHGPHYPLGGIAGRMRAADLTVINLECALTARTERWRGAPKAFYFGAPPEAIGALTDAGVDLVSLANNHTLDFEVGGLFDTLAALDAHGIAHAGAGADTAAAHRPAIVERGGLRFGMAAFCDHQRDFAAGAIQPGIAWLDLDDEPAALAAIEAALDVLRQEAVDWPVLSLHWGPNMVWRPSRQHQRLAHAAIDMGWKILFGHSAHVFHGVEWRRGCPIIYAAGDLVDDYYVDPEFRNDHQMLFELELAAGRVARLAMLPLLVKDCRTAPATGPAHAWTIERMRALCREFGTASEQDGETLVLLSQ